MGGLRGRELAADMGLRATRMARLSDAGLLELFMLTRRSNLASGCSIIEANERAHVAVEARIHIAPVTAPAILTVAPVIPEANVGV